MEAHSASKRAVTMQGIDQYKAISKEYKASKQLPVRDVIEKHILLALLRDTLAGASTAVDSLSQSSLQAPTRARPAILDLACGDGHYARLWAALGAQRVVGVDLCPEMVALGRAQGLGTAACPGVTRTAHGGSAAVQGTGEQATGISTDECERHTQSPPCDLTYVVGDALDATTFTTGRAGTAGLGRGDDGLIKEHSFDAVTGVYVLNYAQSEEQLEAMVRTAAAMLKPGGLFVGMNNNPFSDGHASLMQPSAAALSCVRYGMCRTRRDVLPAWHERTASTDRGGTSVPELQVGEPIHLIFVDTRAEGAPSPQDFPLSQPPHAALPTFRFDNFHLPPRMHEEVFQRAGFTDFQWIPCSSAPPSVPAAQAELWAAFCAPESCPLIGFSARTAYA